MDQKPFLHDPVRTLKDKTKRISTVFSSLASVFYEGMSNTALNWFVSCPVQIYSLRFLWPADGLLSTLSRLVKLATFVVYADLNGTQFLYLFWQQNCCLCFQSWTKLTEHEAKCSKLHFVDAARHFCVSRCRWMLWRTRNARGFHQSQSFSMQKSLKYPTLQMNSFQRRKAIMKIADVKPLVCYRVPCEPRRLFSTLTSLHYPLPQENQVSC